MNIVKLFIGILQGRTLISPTLQFCSISHLQPIIVACVWAKRGGGGDQQTFGTSFRKLGRQNSCRWRGASMGWGGHVGLCTYPRNVVSIYILQSAQNRPTVLGVFVGKSVGNNLSPIDLPVPASKACFHCLIEGTFLTISYPSQNCTLLSSYHKDLVYWYLLFSMQLMSSPLQWKQIHNFAPKTFIGIILWIQCYYQHPAVHFAQLLTAVFNTQINSHNYLPIKLTHPCTYFSFTCTLYFNHGVMKGNKQSFLLCVEKSSSSSHFLP